MKERLVGAAVLVAIAVWLIPWVLDGPESGVERPASSLALPAAEEPMPMQTRTLRLGEAPATSVAPPTTAQPAESPPAARAQAEAREEPKPEAEARVAAAESREEPKTPAAETTTAAARSAAEPRTAAAAPAAPPPQPKATPAPTGDWTVQLGSFGEEANARRMAQRAGTFGYKADVSSYSSGGRTLYRVRVGPQRTRAEADAAASALRAHGIKEASVVAAR